MKFIKQFTLLVMEEESVDLSSLLKMKSQNLKTNTSKSFQKVSEVLKIFSKTSSMSQTHFGTTYFLRNKKY